MKFLTTILLFSCSHFNMTMPVKVVDWKYERGNRVLTLVNDCNDTIPYTEYKETVNVKKEGRYILVCDTSKIVKGFYRCTLKN